MGSEMCIRDSRRFGQNPEKFDKELASLARAGFGYHDARRALDVAAKEEE